MKRSFRPTIETMENRLLLSLSTLAAGPCKSTWHRRRSIMCMCPSFIMQLSIMRKSSITRRR